MVQPKVKIRNIKTKAITEVNKNIAGEYIGTGEFELVKDENKIEENVKKFNLKK